jgi:phytoene desaturase
MFQASYEELRKVFEQFEPGSAKRLDKFLEEAKFKYETGMKKLVHKPGLSITEFFDWDVIKGVFRLDVFNSIKKAYSKNIFIIQSFGR